MDGARRRRPGGRVEQSGRQDCLAARRQQREDQRWLQAERGTRRVEQLHLVPHEGRHRQHERHAQLGAGLQAERRRAPRGARRGRRLPLESAAKREAAAVPLRGGAARLRRRLVCEVGRAVAKGDGGARDEDELAVVHLVVARRRHRDLPRLLAPQRVPAHLQDLGAAAVLEHCRREVLEAPALVLHHERANVQRSAVGDRDLERA
mmetsp:Transcript_36678/g.115274  ORF Transcript_36678/g.115274 Transcript_36678/m.115274 type:complete len:206 (+) Transcript_36678:548-1165(+)